MARTMNVVRLVLILLFSGMTVTSVLLYLPSMWISGYRNYPQLPDGLKATVAIDREASVTSSAARKFKQKQSDRIRCADLPARYPDSIPPLVHWTSKDGRVPAPLIPMVKSWRLLLNSSSTNWHFMHWDDRQIGQLISDHYPLLETSHSKLVTGLERSDIGRLVVLHHIGGVYVDMDVELRRDLSPLLMQSRVLRNNSSSTNVSCCTAIWAQEPIEHAVFLFGLDRLITNAIVLSRANHSFLSYVLRAWPAWFETNWAKKTGRSHGDAVHVTGPLMLQAFYERYLALPAADRPSDWSGTLLADPDMFQPIWDKMYMSGIVKHACASPGELSGLKKRRCSRLAAAKFRTKPVPAGSFTVHRYRHLSYTNRMGMMKSINIDKLLPIEKCFA